MKTLINKSNPHIRITAPEIIELEYSYEVKVDDNKSSQWLYVGKDYWTLVEEEPERREEDMILGLPLKMIKRELDPMVDGGTNKGGSK